MVLYFSGTGNSQLVAKRIAESLGDELESINNHIKTGGKQSIHSEKPLVFVSPTYAWRIPRVVSNWISNTTFSGKKNAYFILTAGDDVGNAARYTKELCAEKEFLFHGLSAVIMPENYIAMYPVPGAEESQSIIKKAEPTILQLADCIAAEKPFPQSNISPIDRMKSGPINSLFYSIYVNDKGFQVLDNCISCGKCVRRCPLNNVVLENNRPTWNGNCTHCMACICCCPVQAIEYKNKSQGQPRYDIMDKN